MKNGNRIEVELVLLVTVILVAFGVDGGRRWQWLGVLSPLIAANVIKLAIIIVIIVRNRRK